VLGQALTARGDYFKARRPYQGRNLTRMERDEVWELIERFARWLAADDSWTWRQVAIRAAGLEMARAADGNRYRHVVVDEAQDLSAAHWRMLRAMVATGPDDMFITGDPQQRIYDNRVTRGQSRDQHPRQVVAVQPELSHHPAILAVALEIMTGEVYDDLDGGQEDLAGYCYAAGSRSSVARRPGTKNATSWSRSSTTGVHRRTAPWRSACRPRNLPMMSSLAWRLKASWLSRSAPIGRSRSTAFTSAPCIASRAWTTRR
jgi:hypothetical protein